MGLPVAIAMVCLTLAGCTSPAFGPAKGVDQGDGNARTGPIVVLEEGREGLDEWRYIAYESNKGLCVELWVATGGSGGCGLEHAPAGLTVGGGGVGGLQFISGTASALVETVELHASSGVIAQASTHSIPGSGFKAFVFVLKSEAEPGFVVGLGEDGSEIARTEVSGVAELG